MIRHAPRDLEAVRLIAVHRFLTRPQLEELLLAAQPLTPRSRQVLACRVRDWRNHLFIETDLGTEGTRFFARKIGRYVDLYQSGSWREFLRVWPRILTVTLNDSRAESLHRATEAMLNSQYAYSGSILSCCFLSIDTLRSAGVRALCYVVNQKQRQ